jgi:small-conductance mechanosensitive channel
MEGLSMINGVNVNKAVTQKYETAKKQENTKVTDKADGKAKEAAAVLELGKSVENTKTTYSKPTSSAVSAQASSDKLNGKSDETEGTTTKLNADEINRLWAEANRATQNLRDMVEELLKSQGKSFKDVLSGKEELIVDEKTKAAAVLAISEDGESGVQAVSDRIVAFAKAISDDNPEMYDKLMSAIDEGFAQAEKAFGGQLPEICKKTHEEISRKMEEWKSGKAESKNPIEA